MSFRDRWKAALKKVDVPATLDLLLRDNTPLPYPKADLRESDKEDTEDKVDENNENEVEEVGDAQGDRAADSTPILIDDPPAPSGPAPIDSVPIPTDDPPVPVDSARVASAPPTETQ